MSKITEKADSILQMRYNLSLERVGQIKEEQICPAPYRDFFVSVADFIKMVVEKSTKAATLQEKQQHNFSLYEDILPNNYDKSYGNPDYAAQTLGEYGSYLSALYSEIRGIIVYNQEKRLWDMVVCLELFLEVYGTFCGEELPTVDWIKDILYWYVSDYCEEMLGRRIEENIDPKYSFATDIVMNSKLEGIEYLYKYGEYISDNEIQLVKYLNSLSQEDIDKMAQTYTEGYRKGFLNGRKPLEKKRTVNIRYRLGFERVVRSAISQFREMGLEPTIYRSATHMVNKRQHMRIGYYGAIPNKQYDYDHRGDAAIFLNEDFIHRKLRGVRNYYEEHRELAAEHAGPACIEVFGEIPFVPEAKDGALSLSEKQQKLQVTCDNEMSQITNRYIKGEERSFTIIAYPLPEIGKDFPAIFAETVKINTLDYKLYERIQQNIILALDQGEKVHIQGKGGNRTDLYVTLHRLEDKEKQTNFENCVADVNIPVGEVFTSPVLTGTNGVLHVKQVYLNELLYKDLEFTFTDGKISQYHCSNFNGEEDNKKYILENVLYHHDTLPMGEFAIGTNTTAYAMARKFGIHDKLPILIAEKMGPHFAVGDTCYSWAEDVAVYNPDGREIIARDNEVSILRRENPEEAYMGCHTDITIPYEELGHIRVYTESGDISIIEDGRFVLPGTEELNEPLQ